MLESKTPQDKISYYVGFEASENGGIDLYTIDAEAVMLLVDFAEFAYDARLGVMQAHIKKKIPAKVFEGLNGYVVFYDLHKTNKKIPAKVRTQVAKACAKLDTLDDQINALNEQLIALKEQQANIRGRIQSLLFGSGVITKIGRFFHRTMLVKEFRVFFKTDFRFSIGLLEPDELAEKAKGLPKKDKKLLDSCVEMGQVTIDPVYYERIKPLLNPQDRKHYVQEMEFVDDAKLEDEVLPKLAYKDRIKFWLMRSQRDEDGNPLGQLHPKTYHVKNPECQECGGKFTTGTTTCGDCGLTSLSVMKPKKKTADEPVKAKPKKKARPVMRYVTDTETTESKPKRKKPKKS